MKLGPYELDQIYTGDARELAKAIPDESVDLIFTDPVYDRIDDYRWLAETGARILKLNKAALVFCGIEWLGETIGALNHNGLKYRWQLILSNPALIGRHIPGGFSQYSICLWCERGNGSPKRQIPDLRPWRPNDSTFHWAKDPNFIAYYIEAFTIQGAIIADFFVGGGTIPAVCKMLGRHWWASEIDPDTAERARQRVANTQPPLFVLQPEQGEFALDT